MKKVISLHEDDGLKSYYQSLYDALLLRFQRPPSPPTERSKQFLLHIEKAKILELFPNLSTQATSQLTKIKESNQATVIKLLNQLQVLLSEKFPHLVQDKVTIEKILLKALDLIRIQFNLLDQEEIPDFLRHYLTSNQLQLIETMISMKLLTPPQPMGGKDGYTQQVNHVMYDIGVKTLKTWDVRTVSWTPRRAEFDTFVWVMGKKTIHPIVPLLREIGLGDQAEVERLETLIALFGRVMVIADDVSDDWREVTLAARFNGLVSQRSAYASGNIDPRFKKLYELAEEMWQEGLLLFQTLTPDATKDSYLDKVILKFQLLMQSNMVHLELDTIEVKEQGVERKREGGRNEFINAPLVQCFHETAFGYIQKVLDTKGVDGRLKVLTSLQVTSLLDKFAELGNLAFNLSNHIATLDSELESGDFINVVLKICEETLGEKKEMGLDLDLTLTSRGLKYSVIDDGSIVTMRVISIKTFFELLCKIRQLNEEIFAKYYDLYSVDPDSKQSDITFKEFVHKVQSSFKNRDSLSPEHPWKGCNESFESLQKIVQEKQRLIDYVQKIILETESVQKAYDWLSSVFKEMESIEEALTQVIIEAGIVEKTETGQLSISRDEVKHLFQNPFKEYINGWMHFYWVYMMSNAESEGVY